MQWAAVTGTPAFVMPTTSPARVATSSMASRDVSAPAGPMEPGSHAWKLSAEPALLTDAVDAEPSAIQRCRSAYIRSVSVDVLPTNAARTHEVPWRSYPT